MKKNEFKNNIINFIKNANCSYTCIKEIEKKLIKNGYTRLYENEVWKINKNKYYVIRNDASIIAIEIPKNKSNIFSIITTHSDTPSLLLKPNGAYNKDNYLKYNIMPYGGLLNYGWLDHPLSLSGRIITKNNNKLNINKKKKKKPMLIIPSVAIHLKSDANTNLDLNTQKDLQPIIGLSNNTGLWDKCLKKLSNQEIIDYDFFAYNIYNPIYINNDLLVSPRIDNLTSVYSSIEAFLNSSSNNIKVMCSFNNEEIGSLTIEGADSNFLLDTLKRISSSLNIDFVSSLSKSFIISSDNTHAIHPNHTEYADDTGILYLNKGFAIIKESSSTTNALSSSIIKSICDKNKIKYQVSTSKNDIAGGSTLSGISLRHVSILSIDVGIPELSMHSSVETCSINDVYELYKMMYKFYESKKKKKKDNIQIK